MVRILADISGGSFEGLSALVKSGKYRDLDQAIEAAVQNQLKLEHGNTGVVASNNSKVPSLTKKKSPSATTQKEFIEPAQNRKEDISIYTRVPDMSPRIVQMPSDDSLFKESATGTNNLFTWGQYNRIFPSKIGLRVLDNLICDGLYPIEKNSTVDLSAFSKRAAEVARDIGMFVRGLDDSRGLKRSERFSNGLPIGREESKSLSRYMNHFLIRKRKSDGILDGFLARLKMVNMVTGERNSAGIGLTQAGLEFSRLQNILLLEEDSNWPLSDEEIAYYSSHVLNYVPEERAALMAILSYINEGNFTTREIDNRLKEAQGKDWTPAVIVTNRAGTLSRLWELKFIERIDLKLSEYRITETGMEFLKASKVTSENS